MKKKLLSLMLAAMLAASSLTVAGATDAEGMTADAAAEAVISVEEPDEPGVPDANLSDGEQADTGDVPDDAVTMEEAWDGEEIVVYEERIEINPDEARRFDVLDLDAGAVTAPMAAARASSAALQVSLYDTGNALNIAEQEEYRKSPMARSSYELFAGQGTLPATGYESLLYPIYLEPGQNLQARLEAPTGVDYDLYLYAFDMSTGSLLPTAISYSIHTNDSSELVESVSYINNNSYTTAYCLRVHSKQGGSSTPFIMYFSIGDGQDAYEPDNNAWSAGTGELGNIVIGREYLTEERTLNSPFDEDWLVLAIANNSEIDTLRIESENKNIKFELFAATNDTNGVYMYPLPSSGDNFYAAQGAVYLRVSPTVDYTTADSYKIRVTPIGLPAAVDLKFICRGTEEMRTQHYSRPNGELRYALLYGALSMQVRFTTSSGKPAAQKESYSSRWTVQNFAWNEDTPNYRNSARGTQVADDGVLYADGTAGQVLGQVTSTPGTTILKYDYDVYFTASVNCPYLNGYIFAEEPIYLTTKYMS